MPGKRTHFNPMWKLDPKFKEWLDADPESKFNFYCKKCHCTCELGNMGKGALNKHVKTKKHASVDESRQSQSAGLMLTWSKSSQEKVDDIFMPLANESLGGNNAQSLDLATERNCDSVNVNEPESSINKWIVGEDVQKAEALWTLYTTVNHISSRACTNTSALFEVMFRDSEISKQFACGKDKNAYLASFGLAPYFSDQLCKTLNECPIYSVSFDESFRITKNEQMDLVIRYWDPKLKCTLTRYIGSEFLGHSTADNLLKAFNKATAHLDQEKIINLGMDGPTTNHKFFRLLQAQREQQSENILCNTFVFFHAKKIQLFKI